MLISETLKKSILQAAIQGKLTEQLPSDGSAKDLLAKIKAEKQKLIAEGKIKKEKPLAPITDDEKPFEIPENWEWVRLGEITKIIGGGTPDKSNPNFWNGDIKWATVSDMNVKRIADTRYKITKEALSACSTNLIKKGAMIIATRVGLGKVCYADTDLAINQDLKGLYFCNAIDSDFSYWYFRFMSEYIMQNGTGTTVKGVRESFISHLCFPLPPLAEQKRIVARVEELFAEIEKLEKDERKLDDLQKAFPTKLKNSLLQAAMQGKLTEQLTSDGNAKDLLEKKSPIAEDEIPFDIPDNWCWVKFEDIGHFISGYTPKSNMLFSTGIIPYFKVSDMNTEGNEFYLIKTDNYLKTVTEKTKYYKKHTIVYPKNGGAVFTNKRRILAQDSVVDLNTGGFTIDKDVDLLYIFMIFSNIDFKQYYKGTALPTLDMQKIKNIVIPLPPLAEQKRIVEKLEELLPLCEDLAE